jgi:hypothetical protein
VIKGVKQLNDKDVNKKGTSAYSLFNISKQQIFMGVMEERKHILYVGTLMKSIAQNEVGLSITHLFRSRLTLLKLFLLINKIID